MERVSRQLQSAGVGSQNTESILSTLLFSAFVGAVLYATFEGCRHITAIYCKRVVSYTHRTPPKPASHVFGWIPPLLRVSDEETLRMVGLDGYVLLRFVYLCWRFSIFCTVWGLIVLFPVYAAGQEKTTLADLTLSTTSSGSSRLWAPTILAYVYSAYFIHLLQQEYKRFFALRQQFLADGDGEIPKQVSYTVMVENIPPDYRDPVAFRAFFERLFPNQVYSAVLCLDLRKLNGLVAERAACRDKLEKAIAYKHATGEEPKIKSRDYRTCTESEEDAIPAYRRRLQALNEEVTKMQQKYAQQMPKADHYDSHAARTIGFLVSGVTGAVADVTNRLKRPKSERSEKSRDSFGDNESSASPSPAARESDGGAGDNGHSQGGSASATLDHARRLIEAVGSTAVGLTGQITKEALYGVKTITTSALHGVTEVTRQLEMMTLGADYSIASTGFVTFTSRVAAAASYQMLLTPKTLRMELRPAFPPRDVIWENVSIPIQQLNSRRNVTATWVIAGGLFWSLIVATIQAWTSADALSKVIPSLEQYADTTFYAVLFGYLPVIALLGLMQLLPLIFYYIALYYEGLKTHSEIDHYVMTRYFYFQVVNIYVTVMFGSLWQSLKTILDEDFSTVLRSLAESLPLVAVYFINLIIAQLFITLPLALLRIYPLSQLALIRLFCDSKKMTRRELRSGPFADPIVYYGWEYPSILMVLMVVVTYMVISPIVCPFGIVFFGAAFLVYKYQLLYTYIPSRESGGKHFYSLYNRAMVVLMASIITLIGYMALREGISQTPCLVPLPVIIFYYWRKIHREYFAASQYLSLEKAVELDQQQEAQQAEDPQQADVASFDPQMYVQPTLIEPPQEPEEYRVTHQVGDVPLGAEDIELSPPAARASLAEKQEALARQSVASMRSKSLSDYATGSIGEEKV